MSAGEFGELVLDVARVHALGPRRRPHGGAVEIVEAADAVGRDFVAVAVPGLHEGGFPARRDDEALWGEVEISHPLPQVLAAIEIINLDPAVGELGARLEGFSQPNGDFEAFAGLDTRCEEPAVGLVAGRFVEEGIEGGTVAWEYPAGCELDGLRLERPVRIEAAFTALRVGEGS